ncbi:uncharacterized protein LOC119082462 [Bradysia coprophila]|uniref:uncharacterized protein LOC119082462 n=1 Tax=Bradysia coprophila TaxID=38358 RepID=UPI00187D6FA4|nr:uncharacterized protein LOC119082462 [Bradysia coprophila]
MAKSVLYLVLICITATSIVCGLHANDVCLDADWFPFEDEKCVKMFTSFADRDDAERICNQHNGTLVTIKSAAEQKFLTELAFNTTEPSNIWIGAQRRSDSETEYDWNDGTAVYRFTNWAAGFPLVEPEKSCVMMQAEWSRPFGISDLEWSNVACTDGGHFFCQKMQTWPVEYLQKAILNARRNKEDHVYSFTDQLSDLTTKLNNANTELKYVHDNPIPIGFIYTQLPDQPEPGRLWWTVEWTDITEQYAGLFFRAEGAGSLAYGTIQAEQCPRLTMVQGRIVTGTAISSVAVPAAGGSTPILSAGATGAASHWGLMFTVSGGEVRPRNAAVRIWMRTN